MKPKTILFFILIFIFTYFLFLSLSFGDLLITGKNKVSGMMGMGTSETSMITKLKGDKMRTEAETKFSEGPMAQMPPRKEISIARLDKELLWQIDPEGNKFNEMSFAQIKQMLSAMQRSTLPDSLAPAWETKKTSNKKKISGFNCEETQITFTTPGQNPMTGEKADMQVLVSVWSTKETKGYEEYDNFSKKMAEKIGSTGRIAGLGMYGIDVKKLEKELDKIEGMEVKHTIIVNLKGLEEEKKAEADTTQKAEEKPFIVMENLIEKFEKTTLPDSDFELPAELKKPEEETKPAPPMKNE